MVENQIKEDKAQGGNVAMSEGGTTAPMGRMQDQQDQEEHPPEY